MLSILFQAVNISNEKDNWASRKQKDLQHANLYHLRQHFDVFEDCQPKIRNTFCVLIYSSTNSYVKIQIILIPLMITICNKTRGQSNLTKSASVTRPVFMLTPIPRLGVTPGGRKLYH